MTDAVDELDRSRLGESRLGELEAALFASSRPLSASALARRLELPEEKISKWLDRYAEALRAPGRGLQLRAARGERGELPLAAVALLQPVATRDINLERGRDSAAPLATLQRRGLVARAPGQDGQAGLWRTTERLLEVCGVRVGRESQSDLGTK